MKILSGLGLQHVASTSQGPMVAVAPTDSGVDRNLHLTQWAIQNITFSHLNFDFAESSHTFELRSPNSIALLFVFKGMICLRQLDEKREVRCSDGTHQVVSLGYQSCTIVAEGPRLQALIICIERERFRAIADKCPDLWSALDERSEPHVLQELFPSVLYLDIPLQTCLQQLLHCHLPAAYRDLYQEAKVMELIALQSASWEQSLQKRPIHSKTEYDRERILFAKEYLLKHMAMPPTLAKLALVSGINEFKLKNGFREMFGNSVFAYLAEARLALAQSMLIEGSKTVTEIAFELGYSSLQHFSSRFKERFGVTPRQLRL